MAKSKNSVTEYRNYYLPMNFPVLLLSGEHWRISDVPSGRQHFHNCLEIGICHSDSGFMEFFGEPFPFRAGDVTVIPMNVPHTTYSTPGTRSHWTYIFLDSQELFRHLLPPAWEKFGIYSHAFQDYHLIFSRGEYPNIYTQATAAVQELEEQNFGYQLSVTGLLLSLYVEVLRIQLSKYNDTASSRTSEHREDTKQEADYALLIAPALDYIEKNYMQQFSIDYLADLCHWSPTHFRRVFREIMGMSPLDFVNNTRIAKACNLLRSTNDSILNISEAVGFCSLSSFNRTFSKVMQIPPPGISGNRSSSLTRIQKSSLSRNTPAGCIRRGSLRRCTLRRRSRMHPCFLLSRQGIPAAGKNQGCGFLSHLPAD